VVRHEQVKGAITVSDSLVLGFGESRVVEQTLEVLEQSPP